MTSRVVYNNPSSPTDHANPLGVVILLTILLVVAFLALASMPQELPPMELTIPRSHAVEKHGADALAARRMLDVCGEGLKRKLATHGQEGTYGLTVVTWCETGLKLCPGMLSTVGGIEKTVFIRPCEDWRNM